VQYAVWCGPVKPTRWYAEKYGVDECYFTHSMASVLSGQGVRTLHVLSGQTNILHPIPAVHFAGIERFSTDNSALAKELTECRVYKTDREIALMRYLNRVSSEAHVRVMQQAHTVRSEHELEAMFLYETYRYAGCRHMSYTCICCSGHNSAILHYGHAGAPNDKKVQSGDMLLLDMGAEYWGYASDITCSFPVNGKFTPEQKIVRLPAVEHSGCALLLPQLPRSLTPALVCTCDVCRFSRPCASLRPPASQW
jgi:Xaa-Pro dipeptidase